MTWIRIDDHRINVEEIVRYGQALYSETPEKSHTEIHFSDGGSIYVTATPEEVDQMIGINGRAKASPNFTGQEMQAIFDFLEEENHHGSEHDCELCSVTNKLFELGFGQTSKK